MANDAKVSSETRTHLPHLFGLLVAMLDLGTEDLESVGTLLHSVGSVAIAERPLEERQHALGELVLLYTQAMVGPADPKTLQGEMVRILRQIIPGA